MVATCLHKFQHLVSTIQAAGSVKQRGGTADMLETQRAGDCQMAAGLPVVGQYLTPDYRLPTCISHCRLQQVPICFYPASYVAAATQRGVRVKPHPAMACWRCHDLLHHRSAAHSACPLLPRWQLIAAAAAAAEPAEGPQQLQALSQPALINQHHSTAWPCEAIPL